jgi:hypothetical protein
VDALPVPTFANDFELLREERLNPRTFDRFHGIDLLVGTPLGLDGMKSRGRYETPIQVQMQWMLGN